MNISNRKQQVIIYLFAVMLGFLIGFISIDWVIIAGEVDPLEVDRLTQITAANYFIQSPWNWPPFIVNHFHYPEGISVSLLDTIPWFAGLFKFLSFLGFETFNYFGLWLLFCIVAQALSMSFLLKSLNVQSPLQHFVAIVFACTLPALHFRFGHASLCAHFLILLALAHYFRFNKTSPSFIFWSSGISLSWLALCTHPYLWAMVTPIVAITFFKSLINHRRDFLNFFLGVSVWGLGTIFFIYILGYIGSGEMPKSDGGFGVYSMNVLSPVLPQYSNIFPFSQGAYEGHPGQYEGMNYLGLGFLSLLAISLSRVNLWRKVIYNHLLLICLLLGMMFYSWSNVVYIGSYHIFSYSLGPLERLAEQFRASGRFFWPCAYALLIGALFGVFRYFPRKASLFILPFFLSLQLLDISNLITHSSIPIDEKSTEQFAQWDDLIEQHDLIGLFPNIAFLPENERLPSIQFLWRASLQNKTTTSAFTPRVIRTPENERKMFVNFKVDPKTLLICTSKSYEYLIPFVDVPKGFSWKKTSLGPALSDRWESLLGFDGEEIKFDHKFKKNYFFGNSKEGERPPFLEGLSGAETEGVWTVGSRVEMLFAIPNEKKIKAIKIQLEPFIHKLHPNQRLEVIANDIKIKVIDFKWPEDHIKKTFNIYIPVEIGNEFGNKISLVFNIGPTKSPKELGMSDDDRQLGFFINNLELRW